jgi:acetyl-CoA carboxylase carboxyl transferase subunit beta
MNWITDFVRPKLQALVSKPEIPDNLWHKCTHCDQMIFHRDLMENMHVCTRCQGHMRISGKERLKLLFDQGEYTRHPLPKVPLDPLKFRDIKRYGDRLKESAARSGEEEALIVATGKIHQKPLVVAAFNFSFMGGSMGMAVGEGIVIAAQIALDQQIPLLLIPSSGGARMQEGILSLMQMPRSVVAIQQIKEAGLPYLVLLTDPTTGGVSASFAMLGDITLAEPGATIGFAGARVIELTIREKLPENFQTAEYLLDHGMVDLVVPRPQLRQTLSRIIEVLMAPRKERA